jgi:hypothetical protein
MSDEPEALAEDELEREGGEALPDRELMSIVTATGDGPYELDPPPLTETPPITEDQPPTE